MSKNPGPPPPVLVTLAEIARIAGVGRAAVSNWRRRHDDFPPPIGGTDTSPQFSLTEVEEWLRRENKLKASVNPLDRLWPEYESLGDRETTGLLVARAGLRLSGYESAGAGPSADLVPDQRQSRLLDRTLELAGEADARAVFTTLLERWLRTHVRQITTTPQQLAELMAEVAGLNHSAPVHAVLDPACGTGTLLAAAGRRWGSASDSVLRFLGQDSDPVLVNLASARLLVDGFAKKDLSNLSLVADDTLRRAAHTGTPADVVLCNPPANERDWGHSELATDPRWVYGQPPRTESELAWVQHAVAALAPGGVAVLVLPPAVAARRAGRRIRAGLLRAGVLRAVIALPPGAAPPYGVGLHLWILRAGPAAEESDGSPAELTLVDTTYAMPPGAAEKTGIDWASVTAQVKDVLLSGTKTPGSISVPIVDLLDEQVDLTPARHIPKTRAATIADLRLFWSRFDNHLSELRQAAGVLSELAPTEQDEAVPLIGIGELERAGALEIRAGQGLPEALVRRGERQEGEARVLTGPLFGQPELWLPVSAVASGRQDGSLTVTASQDIVVSALARAFDVQVDTDAPSVLGPQLSALRVNPAVLDPWFLAGCLRAPANVRRAGTHASTTSRIDVRRLQVPRLPLEEQRRYGEIHRKITVFERELQDMKKVGAELGRSLGDLLAAGQLRRA